MEHFLCHQIIKNLSILRIRVIEGIIECIAYINTVVSCVAEIFTALFFHCGLCKEERFGKRILVSDCVKLSLNTIHAVN